MLSYSLHISSGTNAINTNAKLQKALQHNLRSYQSSEYNKDRIVVIAGKKTASDTLEHFKNGYHYFFDEALAEYNAKQSRSDRKIENYYDHVCQKKNQDIAVEMIVQIGSKEDWENIPLSEQRKMDAVYFNQLKKIRKLLPDFRVISAVIHYDEASPHMQLIGVPLKNDCTRGLKTQVSKRSVFTKETLSYLQDEMRKDLEKEVEPIFKNNSILKPKTQGRMVYYSVPDYKRLQDELRGLNEEKKELFREIQEVKDTYLASSSKNPYEDKLNGLYKFIQFVANYLKKIEKTIKENISTLWDYQEKLKDVKPVGIGNYKKYIFSQEEFIELQEILKNATHSLFKGLSNGDVQTEDYTVNVAEIYNKKMLDIKKITDQMLLDTNAILSLPDENKEKAENYETMHNLFLESIADGLRWKEEAFEKGQKEGLEEGKKQGFYMGVDSTIRVANDLLNANKLGEMRYNEETRKLSFIPMAKIEQENTYDENRDNDYELE